MDDLMFAFVRWVITAYHCVSSNLTTWEGTLQPADVRVILGLHTSFAVVLNVSSIFAAPNRQDVALLQIFKRKKNQMKTCGHVKLQTQAAEIYLFWS